jgi:hypothetical protein
MLPVSDVDRTETSTPSESASLSTTIRWSGELIHHVSEDCLLQDLSLQTRLATKGANQ